MSFLAQILGRKPKPRKDNTIEGALLKDVSQLTSSTYVAHPATEIVSRVWGIPQFEDLNRYYNLYYNVPYIKSAIDVLADFTVKNGWDWEGGSEELREYLRGLDNDLMIKNFLREHIRLGLVYGTAYAEIIYENQPPPLPLSEYRMQTLNLNTNIPQRFDEQWMQTVEQIIEEIKQRFADELKRRRSWGRPIALKSLDSRYMRVLGDSKGIVWGFLQIASTPYVYLRRSQILYWCHGRHSELYEYYYGTSILRPLMRIQAILTQLEEDISLATHFQAYTPIKAKVGDPQNPLPESKFMEIKNALEARKAGGNIIVPGYVDVEWMPTQQTLAARIEWFFKHLLREREQALGIPRLFFGEVSGVSRASAELLLQEFEAKISGIQDSVAEALMEQLYLPTLLTEYPNIQREEIPHLVWRPALTGELRQKVISAIEILRSESISEEEKEKALEYIKDVIGVE